MRGVAEESESEVAAGRVAPYYYVARRDLFLGYKVVEKG